MTSPGESRGTADAVGAEPDPEHEDLDRFSPLRRDNLRRAGLGVVAATAVFAIVLAVAWALRTPPPGAHVRACGIVDDVGAVTLDEVVRGDTGPAVYRQLARVRRIAADSGHAALADAARTAMAGLADAVDRDAIGRDGTADGRAAALFSRGLTDARNACSLLES